MKLNRNDLVVYRPDPTRAGKSYLALSGEIVKVLDCTYTYDRSRYEVLIQLPRPVDGFDTVWTSITNVEVIFTI